MLATLGLLIVFGFMVLIMTKKASPFIALVLVPLLVAIVAGAMNIGGIEVSNIAKYAIAGIVSNEELGIKGVAGTAVMLLFAILYFGLMLSAGLFSPLSNWIIRRVKGDPMKVLIGTAILALFVSVDGDGSTTTLVVCSAMIPIYKRLNMKMMDLAVLIILANSIMNLRLGAVQRLVSLPLCTLMKGRYCVPSYQVWCWRPFGWWWLPLFVGCLNANVWVLSI